MERKQEGESMPYVGITDIALVSGNAENPIAHRTHEGRGKNRKVTIDKIWDWDNLLLADKIARKGKSSNYGVRKFDKYWWQNMTSIQESLVNGTYRTGEPHIERRMCEHKWRVLAKLHYGDHVVHHALMNVCEPILEKSYYYESAASIKGRGIHYAQKHVRKYIDLNSKKTMWWSQLDFEKCYHHVNRQKVYDKICRTFNDEGVRRLFHEVIWALENHNGLEESDGTEGMGIGLYPVQPLVNFYLNDLDRHISRMSNVKLFRYCDNMLIIGFSLEDTWRAVNAIIDYCKNVLEQPLHTNVGVQRLDEKHPIDFVGYKFYITHTLVRDKTKHRFKRAIKNIQSSSCPRSVLASYKGWLQHADGLHLWQTVTGMKRFSELGIKKGETMLNGQRYFDAPMVSASFLVGREVIVKDIIEGVETKNGNDRMCVLVEENGSDKKFLTNNPSLKDILLQVRELDEFPFSAILRSRNIVGNKIEYYFE